MPSTTRILIVEDEPVSALALGETVIALGHQLAGYATTAVDALKRAAAERPDLVLIDIGLGRNDGLWAAARIREAHGLPVVFVGSPAPEAAGDGAASIGPVVVKPYAPDRIGRAIAQALGSRAGAFS
jgi:CheY-like chemotaxis protein